MICASYLYRQIHGDHHASTSIILRYGMPERSAAALLTAFMHDEVMLTTNRSARVIDRNVIRRWKQNVFSNQIPNKINSIYFDGKIDKTRQSDGYFRSEDHITIISEPGSEFITHVTPTVPSTSANIARAIIEKIEINDDLSDVKVIYIKINIYLLRIM